MSLYEDPQGSLIVQYAYRSPGGKFEVNYIDLNTQKIVLSSAANPEIAQQTGMQPYIEQYGWVRLLPSPLSQRLADGTVVSQVWFPACAWLINGMLSVVRPDGTATTIAPVEFLPRPMRYELKDTRGCRAPYPSDGISTTLRSVWGDLQRLSDDSFLLMDTGGPFVVRFDKSLRTEFVSPRNNFLVLDGAAILHEDAKLAGDTTHYEKLYDFVWGLAKGRMP